MKYIYVYLSLLVIGCTSIKPSIKTIKVTDFQTAKDVKIISNHNTMVINEYVDIKEVPDFIQRNITQSYIVMNAEIEFTPINDINQIVAHSIIPERSYILSPLIINSCPMEFDNTNRVFIFKIQTVTNAIDSMYIIAY